MADTKPILANIKRYVALSSDDEAAFTAIVRQRRVKKRQFVEQPGFTCQFQTYVYRGALRSYFINPDGVEHTIQFAVEDWFISDFNSYITQTPASLYVEALEDSTIQQIGYADVEALCEAHPVFERFFRLVAQKSFAYAQRRVLSNLGKTAEERYLEFLGMYPGIVQRVPQYMLASYLGMTPEFLSRIRRNLAAGS